MRIMRFIICWKKLRQFFYTVTHFLRINWTIYWQGVILKKWSRLNICWFQVSNLYFIVFHCNFKCDTQRDLSVKNDIIILGKKWRERVKGLEVSKATGCALLKGMNAMTSSATPTGLKDLRGQLKCMKIELFPWLRKRASQHLTKGRTVLSQKKSHCFQALQLWVEIEVLHQHTVYLKKFKVEICLFVHFLIALLWTLTSNVLTVPVEFDMSHFLFLQFLWPWDELTLGNTANCFKAFFFS